MNLAKPSANAAPARPHPEPVSRRLRVLGVLHGTAPPNPWVAWGLLVAGIIITVLTALHIKAGMESAAQREFDFACNEIRLKIEARLEAGAQILRSGAALFDASETVSRGGWRTFAQRLQIEQHLPGIQGIGFAALIPRAQLDQHVQAIRSEGFPDYQVRPAGERESYSAIVYLEPFEGRNQRAFGYDMLSEPVRRAAMERARDENTDALSGKVLLMQETDQEVQAGGLLYVPVYRHGLPIETIEQRRAALQGWVYSPYRMTDLMRGTLGHWDVKQKGKEIALQVYDGDGLSADTLLYDSQGATGQSQASTARTTRLTPVDFAGHRWTLRFTQRGGMVSLADYGSAWLILFSGTLGTLLLCGLMLWRRQRIRFYREQAESAEALQETNEYLENLFNHANAPIIVWDADGKITRFNHAFEEIAGVKAEQVLGKGLDFLFAENAREQAMEIVRRAGAGERLDLEEVPIRHASGSQQTVLWNSAPIFSADHQRQIATIAQGQDITKRKQAEIALAETKALLQAALDHSQAGIAIADAPSGRLLYVNKAGLLIGGETEAELVTGVEVNQYVASWKLLNLDGTPLAKEEVPLARAVLFGEPCTREFIIRRSEHDDRIVLANAAPIRNPAGAVTAGIVVFLDITEHKRAEELLRQNTEELRARNEELTRFNRLMTGRELRTIELKQQVNDLAAQLGQSRPYPLAFLDAVAAEIVRTTPKPNDQGAEVRGQKSEVSDQKSEVSKTQKEKSP
jgi:PAS domain S-box-containing protein